ncbi:Hypothetical predicted protein [Scomber scombrus]|uniref:Uncharacterized protein n=1 Tax=Scomber scombrus TaxID=13677 RepID=A0AAV1MY47_SCOSC
MMRTAVREGQEINLSQLFSTSSLIRSRRDCRTASQPSSIKSGDVLYLCAALLVACLKIYCLLKKPNSEAITGNDFIASLFLGPATGGDVLQCMHS